MAIRPRNGKLSILTPGKGMLCNLSFGACNLDFFKLISTKRVCSLAALYSGVISYFNPIPDNIANSISRNSIGARLMVISELVTIPAAIKLIASIGSSEGKYSTSLSILSNPVIFSVVVPIPSIITPNFCKKKHRSCTM